MRFFIADNLGINTEVFSITAWVKPDGIQPDYSGIAINNGTTAGLNFRGGNNTLGYHWPGGSWSWNSRLIVTPYQWSHVALVADRDKVTLYVNGVAAIHETDSEAVDLTSFDIGSYKGWGSRNFTGQIDEVCFWKKALTEEEIRAGMHLTKENLIDDSDLLAYYQFNEPGGSVLNKAGSGQANMYGNAQRVVSAAPVGAGVSQTLLITNGGEYVFGEAGVNLSFPDYGFTPNGEVVVTSLNNLPNVLIFTKYITV